MTRFSLKLAMAALSASLLTAGATAALAQHASLTRVEPRPFYGATVTLEAGVRVFRTLPSTRRVIINPGHKTQLNISDTNIRETRTINTTINDNRGAGAPVFVGGGSVLPYVSFGGRRGRGRFDRRRNRVVGGAVQHRPNRVRRMRRAPKRRHH